MDKAPGNRLRQIRNDLKLSTYEMAERLGMPQATYSKAENGYCSIKVELLTKLYVIFKVQPLFICLGNVSKYEKEEKKPTLLHDLSMMKATQMALEAKVDYLSSRPKK